MRAIELVREILATVRSQKVSTVLVALLAMAMCVTTLLTVGRAAAVEQQLQARIEKSGSRVVAFTDSKQKGFLTRDVVAQISTLNVTERAIGLTSAADVTTAATGEGRRVASWQVVGAITDIATLVWGRWPQPGEAVVSATAMTALALDKPVGSVATVTGINYPVVGQYAVREPFTQLNTGVLIQANDATSARILHVIATTPETVPVLKAGVVAVLNQPNEALIINSPIDIAKLQVELMGDLEAYGRSLLAIVLVAGATLTAIVVLAEVLLHRAHLGRRRALGAPKWVIISLVMGRSALAGALGALFGTTTVTIVLAQAGNAPTLDFAVATALLATLTAALAALPPAVAASCHDPIRILRTP